MKTLKLHSLYLSMLLAGMTCSQVVADTTLTIRNGDIYDVTSEMTMNDFYYVEDGTLNVLAGGNVSANLSQIGLNGGTGVVNILDGGKIYLTYNNNIYHSYVTVGGNQNYPPADHTGSTGTLNISGADSLFQVSPGSAFVVGSYGAEGIINITDGGTLRSLGHLWIGGMANTVNQADTRGVVNVSGPGSALLVNSWLRMGMGGEGELHVRDGGLVHVSSVSGSQVVVGTSAESLLTIGGENSRVRTEGAVFIGMGADGTAVIFDGGTLEGAVLNIASGSAVTGTVAIGALEGDAAQQAGHLDVGAIAFGSGTGSIVLNHTSADYALAADISGSGAINVLNGTTWLTGNNSAYTGDITTSGNGTLAIAGQQYLGDATLTNNGSLLVRAESGNDWTLSYPVSGSGNLIKDGAGRVTLTDSLQSTGNTTVLEGTLWMGSSQAGYTLNSPLVATGRNGQLISYGTINGDISNYGTAASFGVVNGDIENYGTLVGTGEINGSVNNNGDLAVGYGNYAIPLSFTINGNVTNNGIIHVGHEQGARIAGNTMYINGDYGGNGTLFFNIYFDGDNTVSDKLYIDGNTSGKTLIIFHELSQQRTPIYDVQLINVTGESSGEFMSIGRLVAGSYEYYLLRGTGENSNHWYLTNHRDVGEDDGDASNDVMFERPEAGAYAANMAAVNTLFQSQFHDRAGGTWYIDPLTGERMHSSMWMRHVGGHQRFRDSGDQLRTQANRYVLQIGGDIARLSTQGDDLIRIGLMGGYANQHSKTRNKLDGYQARGKVSGYSAGMYATWLQNQDTGAYLDSWALWNRFDNTVSGDALPSESYKSKGLTASLEAGYVWKVAQLNERENVYLQPSAQVTWMGVKADKHQEKNGTIINGRGENNVQSRLGVRASLKHEDAANARIFEPFVEANWIHNTKLYGVSMNGDVVDTVGSRDLGEVKVGVEGQLTQNLNLWSNVSQQVGREGYSDTGIMLGMKYTF